MEAVFRLYPGYRNIFESVTVNGSMVIMQGYSICSDQVLNNVHAIWVAEIKENKRLIYGISIRTRKRIEISLVYKHETMSIGEYK